MGIGRLQDLARSDTAITGVVAALLAELRDADWAVPEDLGRSYPSAAVNGSRVTIAIDDDHDVCMLVNYATRCVLIETAGRRPTRAVRSRGRQG